MSLKNPSPAWLWPLTKASVTIFPLLPIFGGLGLLYATWVTWRRARFTWKIGSPLTGGLLLIGLWLIITAFFSRYRLDAWLGLANFIPFFLIFIFFSHIVKTPQQLRQLAWRLVLPSLAIVLLGLGQLWGGWETPLPLRQLSVDQIYPYGNPSGRMSSLFMYANTLAAYLLVIFILGLGLWIDTYRRSRQGKEKVAPAQLVFLGLVVLGDGLGLILTDSRNAWGVSFLAGVAFALYFGWRWLVAGLGAIAATVSLAAWAPNGLREIFRTIVPAFIWLRLSDQLYQDRRPLPTLRSTQWQFTWEMMQARPWTGWGLRNFTPLYEAETGIWLGHPHNLYLMLGSETGWIGLGMFLLWVGGIMVKACRLQLGEDSLIFFTYLVAFSGCILFNILDVTILDGKLNALNWMILGAIGGMI